MCFSPEASFSASAVLVVAGVIAVKEAKFTSKLAFAFIPVFCAVQQFSEGILWLALQHPQYNQWRQPATYFFLVFAQVVWPFWVPFSIYLMEKKQPAKNILMGFTLFGGVLSLFLLYRIMAYPVSATIECYHIFYDLIIPISSVIPVDICYLFVVLIPPFVSSAKKTSLLGIIIAVALVISELFYTKALISVWCFFAAILSVVVIYVLYHMPKRDHKNYKDFHTY